MKNIFFTLFLISQVTFTSFSQSGSPYKTSFAVDAPLLVAGGGLTGLGLYLTQKNKDAPTAAELAEIDADPEAAKNKINKFDRFAAGNFSESAKTASDLLCYPMFLTPAFLLFDKDIKSNSGQMVVMYLETMALSNTLFTTTISQVTRFRPLVYDSEGNNPDRIKKHSTNSFYAGHTSNTAAATFFVAKVFHDYNPESNLRPYIWGAAAAVPAAVGYFRLKAGKHFLSDNILGYVVGAGCGILVPQLHKKKDGSGLSVIPVTGEYTGMVATLTF